MPLFLLYNLQVLNCIYYYNSHSFKRQYQCIYENNSGNNPGNNPKVNISYYLSDRLLSNTIFPENIYNISDGIYMYKVGQID